MELKPVLNYNGCLNFEASSMLHNIIAKIKGQLVHKIFLLLCVFILYSMRFFHISGNVVNLGFVSAEIIFVFLASWVFYYNVKTMRSIIITIANQVSITDDKISITSFTYNLPFSNKTRPDRLEFKISELKIRKTGNPSMFTRALGDKM
jgi:protein-S-isoprenylcysteine O-methyltransferase Ste14